MRIDQALDFIHAGPPESLPLSDLLSPELVPGLLGRDGLSMRRRRMPMEQVQLAMAGCPCFVMSHPNHLISQLGQPARYPVTRRPAVCRPQRSSRRAKLLCSIRPPADWHFPAILAPHLGHQLLAVDGVVWRTSYHLPAPCQVETVQGETQYPRSAMFVSDGADQSSADPDSDGPLCGKRVMVRLAEQLIEKTPDNSLTLFDKGFYSGFFMPGNAISA